MSYLKRHRHAPRAAVGAPLPGQAPNSAGGFAWAVDTWTRLRRFLVLGSEGGSYYASERTLTRENAKAVEGCVARGRPARGRRDRARLARGPRAEERPGALRARAGGRPRRRGDAAGRARRAAAGRPHGHAPLPVRARSSRASAAGAARSAARSAAGTRRRPADALAYQAVKYRQRAGVTHRDLLRLAHPARAGRRGQPGARRLRPSTLGCSSGSSAAARRTACRGWSRASRARRRRRRRARRRRSSASTACRARRSSRST